MEREGVTSADVRAELTLFETGDANHQVLSALETDYLTWVYCLLAQREPKKGDILAFYRARSLFPAGGQLPSRGGLPPRWQCRRRIRPVIGREVAPLRVRYERLQVESDRPAQEIAVNEAIAGDPQRASVLRARRQCEKSFHANYKLLLEMRKNLAPPFTLPGGPVAAWDLRKKGA